MPADAAAAQAAVNAAVVQAIKQSVQPSPAQAQAPDKPVVTIDVPRRNAADAAVYLRDFLKRTHKTGSKKHPVQEVKDAQRDMGQLAVDGVVGSKTRARAKQLGVTLP